VLLINKEAPAQCSTASGCVGNDLITQQVINGVCVTTTVQNDSTCIAQQQAQAVTGNQSIFLPISSIANTVVNTTTNQTFAQNLQANGYGWLLIFITPIFWLMLFDIALMIVASYISKHMEIGIASGVLMLFGFGLLLYELTLVVIAFAVIAAYIVGRYAVKSVSGG
jgi:hypothetical protein